MQKTQQYIQEHKDRFLNELVEILKIPSISADSAYNNETKKMAAQLESHFKTIGLAAYIVPTAGHPAVIAHHQVDPALPTVLIYGHYDVQPPDPLNLWDSPPFEPVIKDGKIFARGSADDKGQIFMHVKAVEAMIATGELPCNVKFLIEGEEEIGSDHLAQVLRERKAELQADIILISDTALIANDIPSITTGLRGLSYVEVEVTGANRDLHSGVYGGAVANPINVLSKMIAQLHDEKGRITIPGFYDQVVELTNEQRAKLAEAPFDEKAYCEDLKIDSTIGENGYSPMERTGIRPTLDVNGIWGGYIGEGAKTVLPSKAFAKISMRLVPNQTPEAITQMFADHFTSLAPKGVKVKVTPHHGGSPAVVPTSIPAYKAAEQAMEHTFGKQPVPVRGGGSIPIVAQFEEILGLKSILMGFGLDSDDIHSPNEHFGLFNFYKGIETIPWFFHYYSQLS